MKGLQNIDNFIDSQLMEWELASMNYHDLKKVKTKKLHFNGFDVLVQFNPNRIVSSSAKVDTTSIESRPCFLCSNNRPKQQQSLPFKMDYAILVNPFPIFPKHLTIPNIKHMDQLIQNHFDDMLDLANHLSAFVVFYNGPKCGASAPDHFHFQAGSKGFLQIEKDFHNRSLCSLQMVREEVKVYEWNDYLRTAVTFQSSNKNKISILFNEFYFRFLQQQPNEVEPMINLITYYEEGEWVVHLFPRILHRPSQYFENGKKQLLLSPASVDMGGVFITPRVEDFLKISNEDVADIFSQVCMDDATLHKLYLPEKPYFFH